MSMSNQSSPRDNPSRINSGDFSRSSLKEPEIMENLKTASVDEINFSGESPELINLNHGRDEWDYDQNQDHTWSSMNGGHRIHRAAAFHNRTTLKRLFRSPIRSATEDNIVTVIPDNLLYDSSITTTSTADRCHEMDTNQNIIFKTIDPKKAVDKYLRLKPERIRLKSSFQVFDLLGHIKYYFGVTEPHRERQIKIRFPEETVKLAEIQGDRAGKDREVTRSLRPTRRKHTIRKVYDQKRGRTIIDPEIREDDATEGGCCESFLQNHVYHSWFGEGIGLGEKEKSAGNTTGNKVTVKYRKASNKFGNSLDIAAEFIDGIMKSVRVAETQMDFPVDSELTENMNYISAQVWLCTFGIHHLFQVTDANEGTPTKHEFEELVRKFELMSLNTERLTDRAITFSEFLYGFGKESLTLLAKCGKALGIKLDTSVAKPLKRRDGLTLFKGKDAKEKDSILLKVVAKAKVNLSSPWENFHQFPKNFRLAALEELAENAFEGVHKLKTVLRFISEDVMNGKFDEEDPTFTTIIILLFDLLRFFVASLETSKPHLDNLTEVMTQLLADWRDLIVRTQSILLNIIELRDMVQLCFDYMKAEYALNLQHYRPSTFVGFDETTHFTFCERFKACFSAQPIHFHYKVEDFMRTKYRDVLLSHKISISTAQLLLKPVAEGDIEEDMEKIEVIFAPPSSEEELIRYDTFELKGSSSSSLPSVYTSTIASMTDVERQRLERVMSTHAMQNKNTRSILSKTTSLRAFLSPRNSTENEFKLDGINQSESQSQPAASSISKTSLPVILDQTEVVRKASPPVLSDSDDTTTTLPGPSLSANNDSTTSLILKPIIVKAKEHPDALNYSIRMPSVSPELRKKMEPNRPPPPPTSKQQIQPDKGAKKDVQEKKTPSAAAAPIGAPAPTPTAGPAPTHTAAPVAAGSKGQSKTKASKGKKSSGTADQRSVLTQQGAIRLLNQYSSQLKVDNTLIRTETVKGQTQAQTEKAPPAKKK